MDADVVDRFRTVADQFCLVVDSMATLERTQLLAQIYNVLPRLIQEAISLPNVKLVDDDDDSDDEDRLIEEFTQAEGTRPQEVKSAHREWEALYNPLREKLGDWDLYWEVFDPNQDQEAIRGSLADDIADIYRDLKCGLDHALVEEVVWELRFSFYSHWGHHAINALRTIHARLAEVEID